MGRKGQERGVGVGGRILEEDDLMCPVPEGI